MCVIFEDKVRETKLIPTMRATGKNFVGANRANFQTGETIFCWRFKFARMILEMAGFMPCVCNHIFKFWRAKLVGYDALEFELAISQNQVDVYIVSDDIIVKSLFKRFHC